MFLARAIHLFIFERDSILYSSVDYCQSNTIKMKNEYCFLLIDKLFDSQGDAQQFQKVR